MNLGYLFCSIRQPGRRNIEETGEALAMYPVYLVRVSFTNRHGSPFHWDFRIETDDYAQAVDEAVLTFWSGLTIEERCDAAETFNIMAQMYYLPEPVSSSSNSGGHHGPGISDAFKNLPISNKSKNLK